jgi:hypothetical protein
MMRLLSTMRQRVYIDMLICLLPVAGCSGTSGNGTQLPTTLLIHDTTGASYLYECHDNKCTIHPTTGTPQVSCSDAATFSYSWDRFFTIVIFGPMSLQRLVACNDNNSCPSAPDGSVYSCISGLCQRPGSLGNVVAAWDAINLCQASDPWPPDCGTAFLSDPNYTAAANKVLAVCAGAQAYFTPDADAGIDAMCTVPPSCLQP